MVGHFCQRLHEKNSINVTTGWVGMFIYLRALKLLSLIIIIMSRYQHGYPWPFTTPPYRPLLPAGPQGYIPYAVCRFELVILPLLVHMKGFTGVHHLWARPNFFSSVPQSGSSNFDSFRDEWYVAVQLLLCGLHFMATPAQQISHASVKLRRKTID